MAPGPLQILVILVIAVLVFGGRGRISSILGDVGTGIRSFRKGLTDDSESVITPDASVDERVKADRTL